MHDWRKAVRTPLSYSVPGSSSTLLRQQTNFVTAVVLTGTFVLLTLYILAPDATTARSSSSSSAALAEEHGHHHESTRSAGGGTGCECINAAESRSQPPYNSTYPLTPVEVLPDGRLRYHIAAVADLDTRSRAANRADQWHSFLLRGLLTYDPATGSVDISWSEGGEERLASPYAAGGRGMELSELVVFNGKLLTCDDRTGIVYEVVRRQTAESASSSATSSSSSSSNSAPAKWDLLPWVILRNGDGRHSSSSSSKGGFKCEWMTVKGGHLYVGSLGKEWTTASGDRVLNADPQWVKRVSVEGAVEHLDWRPAYAALVRAAGITSPPGYLIHEAAVYSERSRRWHFLPRRASHDAYNEVADEQRATNIVLSAEGEDLGRVNLTLAGVGRLSPTHGFSSVKLLPLKTDGNGGETSQPEIALALKSEESGDTVASYVTVFRLDDGRVLLPETRISAVHKYEGVEFV